VRFLSEQAGERKLDDRSFQYNSLCWRLLNSLAEQGKQDDLKQVFDALVKYEYIEPNNILLGPLIKVHIVRQVVNTAYSVCGVKFISECTYSITCLQYPFLLILWWSLGLSCELCIWPLAVKLW
jgi:hypothetical protein